MPQPDAEDGRTEIYLWRVDDPIVLVSGDRHHPRSPPCSSSHSPSVDRDGGKVAFVSTSRLAPGDTNDSMDVYLRDLSRRQTVCSSVAAATNVVRRWQPLAGAERELGGTWPSCPTPLSHRGIATERATLYIYDAARESIQLVSRTSAGVSANSG